MKTTLMIFLSALLYSCVLSQVTFTGTTSPANAIVSNSPIIVDNALVITTASNIDAAKVAITANHAGTDMLSFNAGLLPAGVSGNYNSSTGILSFSGTATAAGYQALLRTVTFSALVAGTGNRVLTFSLGSAVGYTANGHFYEYVTGGYSWTGAKANAPTHNLYGLTGYLATSTSTGENDFILQKVGADGWIGGSDDVTEVNLATGTTTYANQSACEGNYYWVTGPEAGTRFSAGNVNPVAIGGNYINWNAGEPNNFGNTENFLQIYITGSYPGKWNDLANNASLGYIIEYGGLPGDPVVDLTHSRTVTMTTISTNLSTTASANSYVINAPAVIVDNAVTVTSGANITDARVTISANFRSGDLLAFSNGSLPAGVGGSYNSLTGVLSFTGTAAPGDWQTLFRTVTFSSSASPINKVVTFSVGNLISASNGHFYEYISTAESWTNAKAAAAARAYMGFTGYLTTITSQSENDFIQQKLSSNGWIGASDGHNEVNTSAGSTIYANQSAAEGNWYWVTGPEAGLQFSAGNSPSVVPVGGMYSNWNSIEPNNQGGNEQYGMIYSSGTGAAGRWNDEGSGSMGYMVEYVGLSTDPANDLSANRMLNIHSILPVRDLTFTAKAIENTVALHWSTGSERNTSRFEVLHSPDGRNFKKITELPAANNSSTTIRYSYTHRAPGNGENYYVIKTLDHDGASTLSDVRKVNIKSGFGLYPTVVTNNQFSVSNPLSAEVTLVVRNATGAVVLKQVVRDSQTRIDATAFPAGIYFAQFGTGIQVLENIRFIKQ
jgi:hypothetical protein